MEDNLLKCPECGGADFDVRADVHRYVESGLDHVELVGVETRVCRSCSNELLTIPGIGELHDTLARLIARQPRRLRPSEFRFLRKHLGLSAERAAQHLGCDVEQLVAWESGEPARAPSLIAEIQLRVRALTRQFFTEYVPPPRDQGDRPRRWRRDRDRAIRLRVGGGSGRDSMTA